MSKADELTPEERLGRIENAIRQMYELECRFKPAKFGSAPMPALQAIVEAHSEP